MVIQLDLVKAYDKLSWSYIRSILKAYGFDQNWIIWVMTLVTMTNFSILLNGFPSSIFTPFRGLRQGDPLSPFLFVLMMEGLGRAIKMENVEGRIQGIKLTPDGEANAHQQFVDDTMLILGFQREQLPSKYLGIPLTVKTLSKKIREQILNKLQDKIRKWTCISLNLVGRLVLRQAVLQAIPIFMFVALPAPQGIKQQIKSIQRDFLWGIGEEKKKWALVAWDKICKPNGSLELYDPETLSKVSGAKLWWRWIKEPNAP
eukprot:PITA_12487